MGLADKEAASETKRLRVEGDRSERRRQNSDLMSMHLMHHNDSDTSRGSADGGRVGQVAVAAELRAIARENDRTRRRSERRSEAARVDQELTSALAGLHRRRY